MSKQTIWNSLASTGLPLVSVAAIMGNMEAESNCEPCRLQGDFSEYLTRSHSYTQQIDNGEISRDDFIYRGPGGGGYGLCQWTYPLRKAQLYDMCKARGKSIADEDSQIAFLCVELCGEYSSCLNTLRTAQDIRTASDAFLKQFERPADQSESACRVRAQFAQEIYDTFAPSTIQEQHTILGDIPDTQAAQQAAQNMWNAANATPTAETYTLEMDDGEGNVMEAHLTAYESMMTRMLMSIANDVAEMKDLLKERLKE